MSAKLDVFKIERLREVENELKQDWDNMKPISNHILEMYFQFPTNPSSLNLNQSQEAIYDRKLKNLAEDYQEIRIKRNDILIEGRRSFSCTVSIYYGSETNSVINLRILQVAEEILIKFSPFFAVVKLRMVTKFVDGTYASDKGIQVKGVSGGRPSLQGGKQ